MPPPPKREIPSSLLGLLAILALPIALSLYAALLFFTLALARQALHYLLS